MIQTRKLLFLIFPHFLPNLETIIELQTLQDFLDIVLSEVLKMIRSMLAIAMIVGLAATGNAVAYYGELSGATGGIDGTGVWKNDNGSDDWLAPTLSWTVIQKPDLTWSYDYTLTVYKHDISHFINEVSTAFTSNDVDNPTALQGTYGSTEVGLFTSANGNPGMIGQLNGLKFDNATGAILQVTFDSPRRPVWGDFYAKGGKAGGTINAVWNAGFALDDPTSPIANGSLDNHILVPDTNCDVPEPTTMILLAMGTGLIARKRRYRS